MYRLGWFLGTGFGIQPWNPMADGPFTGSNVHDWMKADLYVDLARSVERAGFDFLLVEDTSQIDDSFRGSAETTLKFGLFAPKNDPLPLVPLMAAQTRHIGIVPTITTAFYPPYLAARLATTLDHLTGGRIGINLVTSGSREAWQNYGYDDILPKEDRYRMANECADVFTRLQTSWDPDAVRADVDNMFYADHTKVHRLDHKGEFFKVRGALNTIPGPQRNVPFIEAGNSPAGRDLAARYGNAIIAQCWTVEEMKAFRADMHARMEAVGRNPGDMKVMFLAQPLIAGTDAEALRRKEEHDKWRWTENGIESMLWYFEHVSGIDFGSLDQNKTIRELMEDPQAMPETMSVFAKMMKGQEEKTLREVAATRNHDVDLGMIGSPLTVANRMDEIMEEVGGDGFLFWLPMTRHAIAEMCDGVAPILQKRGSIRSHFSHATLRENLLSF